MLYEKHTYYSNKFSLVLGWDGETSHLLNISLIS